MEILKMFSGFVSPVAATAEGSRGGVGRVWLAFGGCFGRVRACFGG